MSEESGMKVFVAIHGDVQIFLKYEDAKEALKDAEGTVLVVTKTYTYNGETR